MAHFAIGGLMHEAALQADEDPDRLSLVHAVHVVQRTCPATLLSRSARKAFHEMVLQENSAGARQFSRNRINPRGVKRKMSNYNLRPRKRSRTRRVNFAARVRLLK
jgi:hypothetical protein